MRKSGKVDYVELPGASLANSKSFYQKAFGWTFTDYGPAYAAFNEGIDGGFDEDAQTTKPLIVLYSDALEHMLETVKEAGGVIIKDIYSFPGGRRFHFQDPSGNEMAVWSET